MELPPTGEPSLRAAGRTCFVIMPFKRSFDDVYTAIRDTVLSCGVSCRRADEESRSGEVLHFVLNAIANANIVIADLTGGNPNVFYETAYAHVHKPPQNVILLAQDDRDVPFDLRALRYLQYDDNREGRLKLQPRLRDFILQALDESPGEFVETIHGSAERTRRLIADYQAVLATRDVAPGTTIRTSAGFTILAYPDEESLADPQGELMLQERAATQRLIEAGVLYKAVLSAELSRVAHRLPHRRLRARRLLQILRDESAKPEDRSILAPTVQFAVSPVHNNHFIIIGDRVLYEGVKTRGERGFELTLRITHTGIIAAYTKAFDSFYEDAVGFTTEGLSREGDETDHAFLRRAVIHRLEERAEK